MTLEAAGWRAPCEAFDTVTRLTQARTRAGSVLAGTQEVANLEAHGRSRRTTAPKSAPRTVVYDGLRITRRGNNEAARTSCV